MTTADVDALLLELADVGVRRLRLEVWPSRSRSLFVATWRQEGRKHIVEAPECGGGVAACPAGS